MSLLSFFDMDKDGDIISTWCWNTASSLYKKEYIMTPICYSLFQADVMAEKAAIPL